MVGTNIFGHDSFIHLPYSVVKAGWVKPIGYWAIPTSVGNTMLLMPSGYA